MSKPNLSVKAGLALQITLHPKDAELARQTLPRQLEAWAPHVDRVVLTIDGQPCIECRGDAHRAARKALFGLLEPLRRRHAALGIDAVVYAEHFRDKIAATYFGGRRDWPDHAVDGSPFYGLFFGLMRANAHRVLHLAPATLHWGPTGAWLDAAQARLDAESGLLALAPHLLDLPAEGRAEASFLLDTTRLVDMAVPLASVAPGLGEKIKAGVLARDLRSRPAMASLAQGCAMAGLAMAVEAEGAVALGREERVLARRDAAWGAGFAHRLRAGADRLVGAQLKRLGRI